MKLAQAEKEFATDSFNNFLQPLRNFLEGDMRTIMVRKIGIISVAKGKKDMGGKIYLRACF